MRKIVLIAAMALTSAAAQAAETRNLSSAVAPSAAPAAIQTKQFQAQNDTPAAAKPSEAPRYAPPPPETQKPADPARNISDAPRPRPAPVDNAPPTAASSAPSTASPSTAQPERRYDDRGYFDDAGYHPFPRRYDNADRGTDRDADRSADRNAERPRGYATHGYARRPYPRAWWSSPRRFMAEMRRYGIYW